MKVLVFLLEYNILVLFPPLAIFKTDQFQLLRREMNQQGAATLSCYEELQAAHFQPLHAVNSFALRMMERGQL